MKPRSSFTPLPVRIISPIFSPRPFAAQPRCVSSTWPTFIRDGTPAGHLVARLHAALHGEVDLDHLEHAGREVVTRGDLHLLLIEALVELRLLRAQPLGGLLERGVRLVALHADL